MKRSSRRVALRDCALALSGAAALPLAGCSGATETATRPKQDLWIDNFDDVEHTTTVSVARDGGDPVVDETVTLPPGDGVDVDGAFPRSGTADLTYVASVSLGSGVIETQSFPAEAGTGFRGLMVSIESPETLEISPVVN